jgi:hypothetical protein
MLKFINSLLLLVSAPPVWCRPRAAFQALDTNAGGEISAAGIAAAATSLQNLDIAGPPGNLR